MKRCEIESFIDERLDQANTLSTISVLDNLVKKRINAIVRDKNRGKKLKNELKSLFFLEKRIQMILPLKVSEAIEEQEYLLTPEHERTDIFKYRYLCSFKLKNNELSLIEGYDKLVKYGYYDPVANKNGVVKDHRISVKTGFDCKLNPEMMSHPRNCEFLPFKENLRKSSDNSIDIITLQGLIEEWNSDKGIRTKRWKEF